MRGIAARGSARTEGAHVCGLRGVFSDAHIVRKTNLNLFRVCGRESLRRFFILCCPFSYNFSFARAYNSRVREKLKGMVTMKEKDNIRHGDVDDMIFGSEAHVSER